MWVFFLLLLLFLLTQSTIMDGELSFNMLQLIAVNQKCQMQVLVRLQLSGLQTGHLACDVIRQLV